MNNKQLPPIPAPLHSRVVDGVPCIPVSEHEHLMRAYAVQAIAHTTQPEDVTDEEIDYAVLQTIGFDGIGTQEMDQFDCRNIARAILAMRPVQVPVATSQFVEKELTVGQRYTNSGQQLFGEIESLYTHIQQVEPKHRHWSEALAADLTESGDIQTNTHPAPGVPDDVVRDAERYRWLRATTNWVSSKGERIVVRNNPELWDSAIDAAIAASQAQKG